MVTGRRPARAPAAPWTRWAVVLVGLAIVAALVWWFTARDGGDEAAAPAAAGESPAPLDLEARPAEVDEASIADVPLDSLVARGPDTPRGIDISNDPRLGSPDAPVVVVEFSDFQCPFCAQFHLNTFPALRSLYGDRVRWYFVNRFYEGPHPHARGAAIAAECAHRQGRFWDYADELFRRQSELGPDLYPQIASRLGLDRAQFDACRTDQAVIDEVEADIREADRVRVDGTPTFFINGQRIVGAQPVGVFNRIIGPYFE